MVDPTSTNQKRFHLLHDIFGDATYNLGCIYNTVDLQRIMDAVRSIVASHAIFPTTFRRSGVSLQQVVHPEVRMEFPIHDFPHPTPLKAQELIKAHASKALHTPYRLNQAPLLRCQAFHVPSENRYCFLECTTILAYCTSW